MSQQSLGLPPCQGGARSHEAHEFLGDTDAKEPAQELPKGLKSVGN
jgi:hypothetical protein